MCRYMLSAYFIFYCGCIDCMMPRSRHLLLIRFCVGSVFSSVSLALCLAVIFFWNGSFAHHMLQRNESELRLYIEFMLYKAALRKEVVTPMIESVMECPGGHEAVVKCSDCQSMKRLLSFQHINISPHEPASTLVPTPSARTAPCLHLRPLPGADW